MPLVKDLLAEARLSEAPFSEKTAGDYHQYVVSEEISADALTDLSEAFEWYYAAGAEEDVNEVGDRLCQHFYEAQQFQLSLNYGLRTEEICKDKTGGRILSNVGIVLQIFGYMDSSLKYNEKALEWYKKAGNRHGEGTLLNNISQIYSAKGDYDTALGYLQQSLKITQEIGDRKVESVTLNNLSEIAYANGDLDAAMEYSSRDLAICREIGDIHGMAITLTNMGVRLFKQNHFEEAAPLFIQAYNIFKQIGSPNTSIPESYLGTIIEKIGRERYEAILKAQI